MLEPWRQIVRSAKFVGALVALIGLIGFAWVSQTFDLRGRAFDRLQVLHWTLLGNEAPNPTVWIVEIDDEALLLEGAVWPYPRRALADLVEKISRAKPSAIGLDIFLAGESLYEPDDDWLEFTLNNTPNLVLGHPQAKSDWQDIQAFSEIVPKSHVEFLDPSLKDRLIHTEYPLTPSSLDIDRAAAGHGFINDDWFKEDHLRSMPAIVATEMGYIAAFALEIARVATNADRYIVRSDRSDGITVRLAGQEARGLELQLDSDFAVRPRLRPAFKPQFIGAKAILEDGAASGFDKGDIVLIGATALGSGDIVATAFGENFGIDAHAQILETILRNDSWLRPPYLQSLEWIAALAATGTALAFVSASLPSAFLVSIVLIGSAIAAALALMAIGSLLFDPSLAIVGVVTAFFASSVVRLYNERRRRRQAENQKLAFETELELARGIQSSILIDPSRISRLPSSVVVEAELVQSSFVGGDFFDAFMLEDNRLFFVVADVSGKGWSGAFFMAIAKAFIQSSALKRPQSVVDIVKNAEVEIGRNNPHELFVTAIVGILDVDTGEIELCNAGHPPPIVLTPDEPATSLKTADAPPIGMLSGFDFGSSRHQLRNGQSILLFTDGFAELTDQEIGQSMQDLRNFLDGLRAAGERLPSARRLIELASVQNDMTPDDVTLLTIKFA